MSFSEEEENRERYQYLKDQFIELENEVNELNRFVSYRQSKELETKIRQIKKRIRYIKEEFFSNNG